MMEDTRKNNITGVILAGGKSRRMGRDKATLRVGSSYLIEYPLKVLSRHFKTVMVVTNALLSRQLKAILPSSIQIFEDIFPDHGALGGIYTALFQSKTPYIFVTACDMPFIEDELVSLMSNKIGNYDIIIPLGSKGYETLHAIYHRSLLPIIQHHLNKNNNKIKEIFPYSKVLSIPPNVIGQYGNEDKMFRNINTITELNESFS